MTLPSVNWNEEFMKIYGMDCCDGIVEGTHDMSYPHKKQGGTAVNPSLTMMYCREGEI